MNRRQFITRSAYGLGAAWLGTRTLDAAIMALPPLPQKFAASDTVTLGKTGIKTSRLAMGTGTVGSGHHSHQTSLGVKGLSELLLNGHDQGLSFLIPQTPTEVILMSPKRSSTSLAIRLRCSPRLGLAILRAPVPISTASGKN